MADEPPVLVDWPPWNHTFGGNHDFGMVLDNGGSFYIDEGKPLPGAIEATVRNLRDVAPTIISTCRRALRCCCRICAPTRLCGERFFSRLKVLFYAGACLAQHVRDELQELAIATTGERIIFLSSLGSTETAPAALACSWESERTGNIGLPLPGIELKLVPRDGKFDARLKGPNITPGYWRSPELTAAAFDDEGFYMIGDALKFADPGRSDARASCSTAGSLRISSSRPAPGSASGRCAPRSSRIARRWSATWCWPAPNATR